MEISNSQATRQALLPNERLVQPLPETRLYAHRLQNQHTHPYNTLFSRFIFRTHGIVQHQNNEIVRAIGLDDEGAEALVDLQQLPKENEHFGCPGNVALRDGEIRGHA